MSVNEPSSIDELMQWLERGGDEVDEAHERSPADAGTGYPSSSSINNVNEPALVQISQTNDSREASTPPTQVSAANESGSHAMPSVHSTPRTTARRSRQVTRNLSSSSLRRRIFKPVHCKGGLDKKHYY